MTTLIILILGTSVLYTLIGWGIIVWDYLNDKRTGLASFGLSFLVIIPIINFIWVGGDILGKFMKAVYDESKKDYNK